MKNRPYLLANEPIPKLLLRLSAPATVGMLSMALYNIVDTIFVGLGVGKNAIAALTVAFPLQMIVLAAGQTAGIGCASIISRALGAGEQERADRAFANMFLVLGMVGVFVVAAGVFLPRWLARSFGADALIADLAAPYLRIVLTGGVFFLFDVAVNNIVRAEGNARVAMTAMAIGSVSNMILDPIFIFQFDMGIEGAAAATVASQMIMMLFLLRYLRSGGSSLRFKTARLRPDYAILREMLAVGFTVFARQAGGSLMFMVVNHSLLYYGGRGALIVFGIFHRLIMFMFMPLMGVAQGLQPIVGYNHGAGKPDRARQAVYWAIGVTTLIAVAGSAALVLFPRYLFRMFTDAQDIITAGEGAVRILVLGLFTVGFQVVAATMYQALGKAKPALVLSTARQIIFLIPLLLILPLRWGIYGVWGAFPASDLLSFLVAVVLFRKEMKVMKEDAVPAAPDHSKGVPSCRVSDERS